MIESTIQIFWLFWFGAYLVFAWQKGASTGRSYAKLLFPILLFSGESWPAGTDKPRLLLQASLLLLVIITALAAYLDLYGLK